MHGMKCSPIIPLVSGVQFISATHLLPLRYLVTCSVFASFLWTSVQGQGDGFVSIDCGALAAQNSTNISWVPDSPYVTTGENANISNASIPYNTLRFFSGNLPKNCYVFNSTANMSYLVRAGFLYGNYDNSNTLPSFELIFDATHWTAVEITGTYDVISHEMIVAASGGSFSVCVARTNVSTSVPFISSLEIRQLSDQNMYLPVHQNFLLRTDWRINFGKNDNTSIRYPDDEYDRIWESDLKAIANISQYNVTFTNKKVTSIHSVDKPPSTVMQTARTVNTTQNMTLKLMATFGPGQYYLALYFAEILSNTSEQRIMDIYIGEHLVKGGFNLSSGFGPFYSIEFYNTNESVSGQSYNLQLKTNKGSTLGPILNAAESYFFQKADLQTDDHDVTALADIQKVFNLGFWAGDPCLPVSYKWSWLNCSNTTPPRVTALFLSNMSLTSRIPDSIANLTQLTLLDLQDNELQGTIPPNFVDLPYLAELNLQNNNLSGEVPAGFRSNVLSVSGNPLLCKPWGDVVCALTPAPLPSSSNPKDLKIGLISAGTILFVMCVLGFAVCRYKQRQRPKFHMANSAHWPPVPPLTELSRSADPVISVWNEGKNDGHNYSFAEVRSITNNFEKKVGGVFYGMLPDGQEIVVKLLQTKFWQSPSEFFSKARRLSSVHHKNLLRLYGFCAENNQQMLVNEYMVQGCLHDHLYDAGLDFLDWRTRLNVLQQVAQGLEHLHCACSPSIVHGNVKSTNVLLTDTMLAKVSDFGLHELLPDGAGVMVDATSGYLDPEYFTVNNLTEKSDVYSFGVLLLEVVSGRVPFDTSLPKEQWSIVDWVQKTLQEGNYEMVADPFLNGSYNINALSKVVQVALQTVVANLNERPTMSEIVMELKEANKLELGHHVAFVELASDDTCNSDDSSLPLTKDLFTDDN